MARPWIPAAPRTVVELGDRVLEVVVVAGALMAAHVSDTWWNLRAGSDIAAARSVPATDSWSWTAAGHAWPNHEWLWQLLAYGVHRLGGPVLLTLLNAVVIAVPLLWLRRFERGRSPAGLLLLGLAVAASVMGWQVRPHLASVLLLVAVVVLVGRERWWPLPLLFALWANLHGGVAAGGVVLLACAAWAVLAWLRDRSPERRRRALALTVVTVLSGAATLLNPMGWGLVEFIVESPVRSRTNDIIEWSSAFRPTLLAAVVWPWVVLTAYFVLRRRDRFTNWSDQVFLVASAALVPFALSAVRNVTFLAPVAMVAGFVAWRGSGDRSGTVRHGGPMLAVVGGLAVLLVASSWIARTPMGWQPIPAGAVAAVEGCEGHLFNTYDAGGVLVWWAPGTPVFVDSRQDPYPADVMDDVTGLGPDTWRSAFIERDIACAALPGPHRWLTRALVEDGWTPVHAGRGTTDPDDWTVLVRPE